MTHRFAAVTESKLGRDPLVDLEEPAEDNGAQFGGQVVTMDEALEIARDVLADMDAELARR